MLLEATGVWTALPAVLDSFPHIVRSKVSSWGVKLEFEVKLGHQINNPVSSSSFFHFRQLAKINLSKLRKNIEGDSYMQS